MSVRTSYNLIEHNQTVLCRRCRETDTVADRLPAQPKGEGLSPATSSPEQFLGQVLVVPGAQAKVNRWRAVSCARSQKFAYHALVRTAQVRQKPQESFEFRTAFPADRQRRRTSHGSTSTAPLRRTDQEEERALSAAISRGLVP